jgi:polyisoprenyl-phosphate glycosyltransferase
MSKVSVMVPVYYNEKSLGPLFIELCAVEKDLARVGVEMELIFIDDGSGDNSFAELLKIKQQRDSTKIIKLTRNFGAAHATKTAYGFVTGDCFAGLAADLQDPPELILEMVKRWQAGAKFVVCSRIARKDPFFARLLPAFYYGLVRRLIDKNYPEKGFDLVLMDKVMLPYILNSGKNINLPLYEYLLGFKPDFVEYERRERLHGKSRWSMAKKLKWFLDSILGFSILPIRIISSVGLIVSILSISYGMVVFVHALFWHSDAPGFATIVALLCFLLGVVIVMLGIIGEYLWRIFDETGKRPETVIEEIY